MKRIACVLLLLLTHIRAESIVPLPVNDSYDPSKAALGKRLFLEPGLSKDGSIACVNCHQLSTSGADTVDYSRGVNGAEGDINAPSVFNGRYHFAQFWDGRAKTLKEQVKGPISNPKEMASSMPKAIAFLKSKPDYVASFKRLYPNGITEDSISDAISEFEKALVTPNSRYDRYLRGDQTVLTAKEIAGEKLFYRYGCISCHNGIAIGGNMYQKIGIFSPYYSDKNQLGRYAITHRGKDFYVFKVPSLRNVALTAPYMHDGKAATLKQAILLMGTHQLGIVFKEKEIDMIEAFLRTLTGEIPAIIRDRQ